MEERILTDEERKLVEDNHELIYTVANSMGIDLEEFYGVLAIGLCHAAQSYDEKKHHYGFSMFASMVMILEWARYYNQSVYYIS